MQPFRDPEHQLEVATAVSLPRSRSTSMSSDTQQLPRAKLFSPPPVTPRPAFIASSAASQIIAADQEFNTIAVDSETACVGNAALALLNGFLDHLLFNILAASKSTQLSCIRPAVVEVLKPRFAREVVAAADDELSEYMGGADDEERDSRQSHEHPVEFDLIRSWKLTRLRCMVYTRLGDMEEEDEEEYIERDGLDESPSGVSRFSNRVGNISPAAAIFLTSIIECIGEQSLIIAGENARNRLLAKVRSGHEDGQSSQLEGSDRLTVEETDMEKLALNATLGRLWRTWRKCMRTPTGLVRAVSRDSFRRRGYAGLGRGSRSDSITTIDEPLGSEPSSPHMQPQSEKVDGVHHEQHDELRRVSPIDPASIALPMTETDVQEIEIPGFASDGDADIVTMEAVVAHKVRPRSLMVFTLPSPSKSNASHQSSSPTTASVNRATHVIGHSRSKSLPSSPFSHQRSGAVMPAIEHAEDEHDNKRDVQTPARERKELECMPEDDETAPSAEGAIGIAVLPGQSRHTDIESVCPEDHTEEEFHQVEEMPFEAPEAVVEPSNTVASSGKVTCPADEVVTAKPSLSDRHDRNTQVIEGQGMCERPNRASLQRPKRMASKEMSRTDDRTPSPRSATRELPTESVVELQPPKQGVSHSTANAVSTPVAVDPEAVTLSDAGRSVDRLATSPVPQATVAQEETATNHRSSREETESPETRQSCDSIARHASHSSDSGRSASISDGSVRSNPARSRHQQQPSPTLSSTGQPIFTRSATAPLPGLERAAVQRVKLRPPLTVKTDYPKPRRSESFGSAREKRPATAGSTTSQVSHKIKGLIGRPPPPADSSSLRLRSSSDTSRLSNESKDSAENDRIALDTLIQSDETIHFTLTPKNMREMELPESPRWRVQQTDLDDTASFLRSTASGADGVSRPSIPGESTRTVQNAPSGAPSKYIDSSKYQAYDEDDVDVMPLPRNFSSNLARDARPSPESVRELATFIKHRGPGVPPPPMRNPQRDMPVDKPLPHQPVVSKTSAANSPRETSGELDRRGSFSSRTSARTNGTSRTNGRPRLEARPAASSGNQTAELIKFIREGPPPAAARAQQPAPGRPVRKQRRVLDPFAIDFDDDDDDLHSLVNTPKKVARQEESLIDFLRNAPAPPEPNTNPQLFAKVSETPTRKTSVSSSSSSMKSRLLRNASFDRMPTMKVSLSSLRSQPESHANNVSSYAAKVGMERMGGGHYASGAAQAPPSFTRRQTETSALADFLRNTGPPEPMVARAPSSLSESMRDASSNSFSRLFSRRKKVEA